MNANFVSLPPSYSSDPVSGERTIQYTPSSHSRLRPTGTYTKVYEGITLALEGQENDAERPSYGRQGVVNGTINIHKTASVCKVRVKMEGKMTTLVSQGGSNYKARELFVESHTLWSTPDEVAKSSLPSSCPSSIPFSCIFPSTFTYHDQETSLPPSYQVAFVGLSALSVDILYTLSVQVVKKRQTLGTKTNTVQITLDYNPRTTPSRPILLNPSFLSSVKVHPNEWSQLSSNLQSRPNSNVEPIHCTLFIPAGRIFGLADNIPLHVQLTGPKSSLQLLLSVSPNTMDTESLKSQSTSTSGSTQSERGPRVSVSMVRQVCVEMRSEKLWRNITIGEGTVRSLGWNSDEDRDSLDWEGRVQCGKHITNGGFSAAGVTVKDLIVLSIVPSNPKKSPLLQYQNAIPIRLATDSWMETTPPDYQYTSFQ